MHIFCRETRAHLEMHPHLIGEDTDAGLITPDLWLKNCKSPDSRSPSPPLSPMALEIQPQTSPLPLITLAHPSKLLASPQEEDICRTKRKLQKKHRKRCPSTITASAGNKVLEGPQDLRIRHSPLNGFDSYKENQTDFDNSMFNRQRHPVFNSLQPDPRLLNPQIYNHAQMSPQIPSPNNVLPPVTVLVPYPILFPVPMPIPIPLPIASFLKAEKTRKENTENSSHNSSEDGTACKEASQNNKESSNVETTVNEEESVVINGTGLSLRKRKKMVDNKSKIQKNTACLTTF